MRVRILSRSEECLGSTTRLVNRPGASIEREVTILATDHDNLVWRHLLEPSEGKWTSFGTVIFPEEAEGLQAVLSSKDFRADPREVLWEAHQEILQEISHRMNRASHKLPQTLILEYFRNGRMWRSRLRSRAIG
jgi:hypothetical protein